MTVHQRWGVGALIAGCVALVAVSLNWAPVVTACADVLPWLATNTIDLVEFVVLLIVVVGMQKMRAELRARTIRFEHIEAGLASLKQGQFDEMMANKAAFVEAKADRVEAGLVVCRVLKADEAAIKTVVDDKPDDGG